MKKQTEICSICGRAITKNNIQRHISVCVWPKVKKINLRNTGMPGINQFSKARDEGREIPSPSEFTKAKALATRRKNGTLMHSEASKKKISDSMKKAVASNPESYSSSNRGRTKQIIVDGIKLQGQWEVEFYLWAKSAELNPHRPSAGFPYAWQGTRTYFPDFYMPTLDCYVEVKGYETERDRAKWDQFPTNLCIVKANAIKEIRNSSFTVDSLKQLLYNKA